MRSCSHCTSTATELASLLPTENLRTALRPPMERGAPHLPFAAYSHDLHIPEKKMDAIKLGNEHIPLESARMCMCVMVCDNICD